MDYLDHARALAAIVRTLEQDVIVRVEDPYARSQLWSTTGILANIARELAVADEAADEPAADVSTLLEHTRAEVAAQCSLHYRKATTGGK